MIWNYPVEPWIYVFAGVVALIALLHRQVAAFVHYRIIIVAVGVSFIAGMLALPSANHLLGDGLTLLGNTDRFISPTEPLDLLLHTLLAKIVGSMLASYRIIAFVAGLFYLLGVYLLMQLGRSPVEKGIIVSSFLATATLQFYFGYVESYTLLNLFLLYYILFAWRDLVKARRSRLPLLFFLLAVLSHFSAVMLLPSLIYIYRRNLGRSLIYLAVALVAATLVVAWKVKIDIIMVPLAPNDFSAYSLFSSAHLHDLFRELLLVCPAFFLAAFGRRFDAPVRFALLVLAGAMIFTILVDPKIGAFRDWDLLSLFALPLALLISLRAPRHGFSLAILAVAIITRILPWLIFNHSLQVEFTRSILADDIHYSQKYDNGYRLRSWGVFLKEVGDFEGAEEAFSKRLEWQPDDLRALNMIVPTLFKLGRYDEANQRCLQGLRLEPNDVNFRYKAIYTAFRVGRFEQALQLWSESTNEFKSTVEVARLYAGIRAAQGHDLEAVEIARRYRAEDTDAYLPFLLARSSLAVGDYTLAKELIGRALELDPQNRDYRVLSDSLERIPQ